MRTRRQHRRLWDGTVPLYTCDKNPRQTQFIVASNGIIMDRLQQMSVFVAVAEEKGFGAGARRLRMSPPAVTRAIATLEKRLGVQLLHRTTRHVRTTEV